MSASLHWRPVAREPHPTLPYALRRVLGTKLWGEGEFGVNSPVEVGKSLLPYLEGLADAGVDGAAELVAIIRQHGVVELWIGEPR